jgi:hypothetical protein
MSINFTEPGPRVSDVNGAIRRASQNEIDAGHVSKIHADEHAKHDAERKAAKTERLRELRDDLEALSK